jgi:hypothetical protein
VVQCSNRRRGANAAAERHLNDHLAFTCVTRDRPETLPLLQPPQPRIVSAGSMRDARLAGAKLADATSSSIPSVTVSSTFG